MIAVAVVAGGVEEKSAFEECQSVLLTSIIERVVAG